MLLRMRMLSLFSVNFVRNGLRGSMIPSSLRSVFLDSCILFVWNGWRPTTISVLFVFVVGLGDVDIHVERSFVSLELVMFWLLGRYLDSLILGTYYTATTAAAKPPARNPPSPKSKPAAPATDANASKPAAQAASPANAVNKPPRPVPSAPPGIIPHINPAWTPLAAAVPSNRVSVIPPVSHRRLRRRRRRIIPPRMPSRLALWTKGRRSTI